MWEKDRVNWCHLEALLNRGADHTNKDKIKNVFIAVNTYLRCARQQSTPLLQGVARVLVAVCFLGNSRLIAVLLWIKFALSLFL